MTAGEWKFVVQVESVFNKLQDPEYRQLVVEALMLVALVVQHDRGQGLGQVLVVDHLIADANRAFLADQVSCCLTCLCVVLHSACHTEQKVAVEYWIGGGWLLSNLAFFNYLFLYYMYVHAYVCMYVVCNCANVVCECHCMLAHAIVSLPSISLVM